MYMKICMYARNGVRIVYEHLRDVKSVCVCLYVSTHVYVYECIYIMYMKICMCARNGARIVYENLCDFKSVCLCLYMNVSTCIDMYVCM